MNVFIAYCHPEPRSFNGTLKDLAVETLEEIGHTVNVSDLYADGFDPVEGPWNFTERGDADYFSILAEQRNAFASSSVREDVRRAIERLEWADLTIFQFPLWWHAQPAILKGWFDRVFMYGGIYTGDIRWDRGHLRGRRAICAVTTGGPMPTFSRGGRSGAIELLMWPIHCSLYYVGFDVLPPFIAYGIQGGGPIYQDAVAFRAQIETYKKQWKDRLRGLEDITPIPFSGWNDWNERGELADSAELRWRP